MIYVDKTKIIHSIIKKTVCGALVINAPRRTGKTLLLDTIQTIFTEKIDWWKKYGANLWITSNVPEFFSENPYPIINFSFSQCTSDNKFRKSLIANLNEVIFKQNLKTDKIDEEIGWEDLIIFKLQTIIFQLENQTKKKPIILIDENDQPLINQFFKYVENVGNPEIEKAVEKVISHMRSFYTKIKELLVRDLHMVIICGHSMIAQTSLYSGNIYIFFLILYFKLKFY